MSEYVLKLALFLPCVVFSDVVFAHGDPVMISIDDNQLATNQGVYMSTIESIGDIVLLADVPGYAVVSGSEIPAGASFALGAAGSLLYWSPQQQSVTETQSVLRVVNDDGDVLQVDNCSSAQTPGVSLGNYDGTSGWHEHVDYLLGPLNSLPGAYAVPLVLTSDAASASEPFLLVFGLYGGGFSQGAMASAVVDLLAADFRHVGDFDADCQLTSLDIDLLSTAVREQDPDDRFDIFVDGQVNEDDRVYWVHKVAGTYFGDADLNGVFTSDDLVQVLAAREYEDDLSLNSTWATGDWDADAEFTSADLILALSDGGYEAGPRVSAVAVPEPRGFGQILLAAAMLVSTRSAYRCQRTRASSRWSRVVERP